MVGDRDNRTKGTLSRWGPPEEGLCAGHRGVFVGDEHGEYRVQNTRCATGPPLRVKEE